MSNVKQPHASWVSPYITVVNADKAAEFYHKAFKFDKLQLAPGDDGTIWHAELKYKDQLIMLGKQGAYDSSAEKSCKAPIASKVESPINLYLYCEDVDKFHDEAVKAGAKSLAKPENMFWGDRMCRLQDPDGYVWCFATYIGNND